jgi:hypothetical protein
MPFLMRPIAASVRPASKAVRSMDKITSILAIVENSASGMVVLDKAVALARAFGARVDLLVADSLLTHEFASRCAARVYDGFSNEVPIWSSRHPRAPIRCAPGHRTRTTVSWPRSVQCP